MNPIQSINLTNKTSNVIKWLINQRDKAYYTNNPQKKDLTVLLLAIEQVLKVALGVPNGEVEVTVCYFRYLDPASLLEVQVSWRSEECFELCKKAVENWPDYNAEFCDTKRATLPELFSHYDNLAEQFLRIYNELK